MKVKFGNIDLTGDHRSGETSGLVVGTTTQVQVTMPIDADDADVINRKNRVKSITFTAQVEHDNPSRAEDFAMSHGDDLALSSGPATFTASGAGQNAELDPAVCTASEIRVIGATTLATYHITGIIK